MAGQTLKQRQAEWIRLWQENGDQAARLALIESCMGLVRQRAQQLAGSGLPRQDLEAEGVIGLLDATDRFDRSRGAPFSACAWAYAKARTLEICRTSSTAAVGARSRPERRLRYGLAAAVARREAQGYTHDYAVRLAAAELGVPYDHAAAAMAMRSAQPLATACGDEDDESGAELVAQGPVVEDVLDRGRVMRVIEDCFAGLDPIERRVVLARTVEMPKPSLDSLGRELGVSRDRVKAIFGDAMTHVRFEMRRRGLELDDLLPG